MTHHLAASFLRDVSLLALLAHLTSCPASSGVPYKPKDVLVASDLVNAIGIDDSPYSEQLDLPCDNEDDEDVTETIRHDVVDCTSGCIGANCGHECGGNCGRCTAGRYCSQGRCYEGVPPDFGFPRVKDDDCASLACIEVNQSLICSATCSGYCPSGWHCSEDLSGQGVCWPDSSCVPDCTERECGPNGCGGSCGACPMKLVCSWQSKCASASDGCVENAFVPGCAGCACEACVCLKQPACCKIGWTLECVALCGSCQQWCPECNPSCMGMVCGDDGCNGSCGTCLDGAYCWLGTCVKGAPPDLGLNCDKVGGCISGVCVTSDGKSICSMTCDEWCPPGWQCIDSDSLKHVCTPEATCVPDCNGRTCGPDGCGGTCGFCDDSQVCGMSGKCGSPGSGCEDSQFPTCNGCSCESSVCQARPTCCWKSWDSACVHVCADLGGCPSHCTPRCNGNTCGSDGCGSFCGECLPWQHCVDGTCICVPQCQDRDCGSDGCGGSCGECDNSLGPQKCDSEGHCVPQFSPCEVRIDPGCQGCACEACVCAALPFCCTVEWDALCVDKAQECGASC